MITLNTEEWILYQEIKNEASNYLAMTGSTQLAEFVLMKMAQLEYRIQKQNEGLTSYHKVH
jgi:hypothetical protein